MKESMEKKENEEIVFYNIDTEKIKNRLLEAYPIGFVPRNKIGEATGGILHSKTMFNKDCDEEGIKGAIRISKKICYPIEEVINFILENIKTVRDL